MTNEPRSITELAFPCDRIMATTGDIVCATGMSLRDYFAAKAMSLRYGPRDTTMPFDEFSKLCYQLADAMLEARK